MALTQDQLDDIRGDIGDTATPPAFTDYEVNRAYTRTDGFTETIRQSATRGVLVRQLLASASKLNDYTAGATSEKRAQVFDHLRVMFGMYARALDTVEATTGKSVVRLGIRSIPREGRTYPDGEYSDGETA